jgi:hypothetical protein
MFELLDSCGQSAIIKVIGVGGGGGNAVQHMVDGNIEGVDFICANTDAQALNIHADHAPDRRPSPRGWAPANPDISWQAAHEDRERITEVIEAQSVYRPAYGGTASRGPVQIAGTGHTHRGGGDRFLFEGAQAPWRS